MRLPILLLLTALLPAADNDQGKHVKDPTFSVSNRTSAPLLKSDRPHEDFIVSWGTVIKEGGTWHMWYESFDHTYTSDTDNFVCYARSDDGEKWEKPELGLVEHNGSAKNNILISGRAVGGASASSVFIDEKAAKNERYKMTYCHPIDGTWQIFCAASPDGIHWTLGREPILSRNADTQNACLRNGDRYRLYCRMWTGEHFSGDRLIGYSESTTFGKFPDPVEIMRSDIPKVQFYNPAISKISDRLYLLLPSGLHAGDGTVRPYLAYSRDGTNFQLVGKKPLIDLGTGFDRTGIYVFPSAVPGPRANTFWFYFNGVEAGHDEMTPQKVHNSGGIGRFLLEVHDR